ncbi:hypothetical protein K502DRAFT_365130 [Neoconidiobolus thromboides FSU 785]|nr:hypothetical protein K502DRAFT_365130 [Neoconidiobolus thromboides FSU 785]
MDSHIKTITEQRESSILIEDKNVFTPLIPQHRTLVRMSEIIHHNHDNHDIIYQEFKPNSVVHVVCSLYKMGAAPKHLDDYYNKVKNGLNSLSEVKYTINTGNYKDFIGYKDSYSSYLKFFDQQVKVLGMTQALKKYISAAIPGLMGAFLNPLVHIGCAVELSNPLVAAEGLAYAYSYYVSYELFKTIELKEFENESEKESKKIEHNDYVNKSEFKSYSAYLIREKLEEIGTERLKVNEGGRNKSIMMQNVIEKNSPNILKLVKYWGVNKNNIDECIKDLSIGTVEIFSESYHKNIFDFFFLHSLTGNHSVRTILPILDLKDKVRLLNINFVALTVFFLTQTIPEPAETFTLIPEEIEEGENNDILWSKIYDSSRKSLYARLIKGTRSLYELQKEFGKMNGLFVKPAAFAVSNVLRNE